MASSLEETISQLEQAETRQRRFVSDVSHELRTPLTALTTSAEVLESHLGGLQGEALQAAEIVVRETRRLKELAEDLLEISRFDAGAATLVREDIFLDRFLNRVVETRGWRGQVEVHVPDAMRVNADPRRLGSILSNLIDNALKHGSPPISVRSMTRDGAVVISVTDHGPGIPADDLPYIFDRFYKGDPSRSRSRGSGLGLAIAMENARLHEGTIEVHSDPGETVFALVLPTR
jgi:two-component system sensor histidine kinase MtrB